MSIFEIMMKYFSFVLFFMYNSKKAHLEDFFDFAQKSIAGGMNEFELATPMG